MSRGSRGNGGGDGDGGDMDGESEADGPRLLREGTDALLGRQRRAFDRHDDRFAAAKELVRRVPGESGRGSHTDGWFARRPTLGPHTPRFKYRNGATP